MAHTDIKMTSDNKIESPDILHPSDCHLQTASDVFIERIADQVNREDCMKMVEAQVHMWVNHIFCVHLFKFHIHLQQLLWSALYISLWELKTGIQYFWNWYNVEWENYKLYCCEVFLVLVIFVIWMHLPSVFLISFYF